MAQTSHYRGRIAPTPTGFLHQGHGATFLVAAQRCRDEGGRLALRIEDLDPQRCKPEFVEAAVEDMQTLGLTFDGETVFQSQRGDLYVEAWRRLRDSGHIFPCTRSRKDLRNSALAPHDEEEAAEPLYPIEWRPPPEAALAHASPGGVAWRFRVPEGRVVCFSDGRKGPQAFTAGEDFGDFVIWRRDDVPAYELAVVVDDAAMGITEVVRGEDLLKSTARQILLYEALGHACPGWYHTELVRDAAGRRLAKRHGAPRIRLPQP